MNNCPSHVDTAYYQTKYDLNFTNKKEAIEHYIKIGKQKGFFPNRETETFYYKMLNFDPEFYKRRYNIDTNSTARQHWKTYGFSNGYFVNKCEELREHPALICRCKIKNESFQSEIISNNSLKIDSEAEPFVFNLNRKDSKDLKTHEMPDIPKPTVSNVKLIKKIEPIVTKPVYDQPLLKYPNKTSSFIDAKGVKGNVRLVNRSIFDTKSIEKNNLQQKHNHSIHRNTQSESTDNFTEYFIDNSYAPKKEPIIDHINRSIIESSIDFSNVHQESSTKLDTDEISDMNVPIEKLSDNVSRSTFDDFDLSDLDKLRLAKLTNESNTKDEINKYLFTKQMDTVYTNITNIKNYLNMTNIHLDTFAALLKQAHQCVSNMSKTNLIKILEEADIVTRITYKDLPLFLFNTNSDQTSRPTSIKFPLFICSNDSTNSVLESIVGKEQTYFKISLMRLSLKKLRLTLDDKIDCKRIEDALYKVANEREIITNNLKLIKIKEELYHKIKESNLGLYDENNFNYEHINQND